MSNRSRTSTQEKSGSFVEEAFIVSYLDYLRSITMFRNNFEIQKLYTQRNLKQFADDTRATFCAVLMILKGDCCDSQQLFESFGHEWLLYKAINRQ